MEPQKLTANRGWEWIKQGYVLFMKAPLLWLVLLLVCFAAVVALSAVPLIGQPLASLLLPVILVGLMDGCRTLTQGEELELAHLFSGFKKHTSQLVTLGGIALLAQFLIIGIMMLLGGATLVNILMSGAPPEDPEIIRQALAGAGLSVLLGIALFGVLMMSMQFAPMLVFFNEVAPVAAMKLSLRAFINNVGAILVYGITLIILAILASIPMMLGWLLLAPIMLTSIYAAYGDIFPLPTDNTALEGEVISRDDQAF